MQNREKSLQAKIQFAALAVDVVCFRILDGGIQILIGKVTSGNNKYKGCWAHIGGLVKVHENADESTERLLREKAGITKIYKEQLYTFSDVNRDPRGRVVSVAYIALTNSDSIQNLKDANTETKWEYIHSVSKLAYDHDMILRVALNRLKSKIIYTDIARYFISEEFTLSDLQKIYEVVLEKSIDKRNFRKRILALSILKNTKHKIKKGVMRPALLYRFK